MGKKQKKDGWLKRSITWCDNAMFSSNTPAFESMLYSVMALGIYVGIGFGIVAFACEAFEVNENVSIVIASIVIASAVAYTIKKILPNIKVLESILKKVLYVIITVFALGVTILIGVYLLVLAIILLILYVILWFWLGGSSDSSGGKDHAGREHVATLDNGVKIYKGSDMMFNSYYKGNDGNYYDTDDNESTFYIK